MNMDGLPFNAFDVFLVVILVAGVFKGRKRGMSAELMSLLKWLTILFVCAVAYEPVASLFGQTTTVFSKLACYIMAYVGAALVVALFFAGLNRHFGGKLIG